MQQFSADYAALGIRHEESFFFGVYDIEARLTLAEMLEKLQRFQEVIRVLDEVDKLLEGIRSKSDEKTWITVSRKNPQQGRLVFVVFLFFVYSFFFLQLHVRTRGMLCMALAGQGQERGLRVWQQMVKKEEMDQDKGIKGALWRLATFCYLETKARSPDCKMHLARFKKGLTDAKFDEDHHLWLL